MGVVLPQEGFLKKLRELTAKNGIVLIFDEVITGFRFTFGGYQNLIGIKPDLTCLGKIIGGGMPVGAMGGKKEIMEKLAPTGRCLSGRNAFRQSSGHERRDRHTQYSQNKNRFLCITDEAGQLVFAGRWKNCLPSKELLSASTIFFRCSPFFSSKDLLMI